MADAAQVAFALFAHIAGEDQRRAQRHLRLDQRVSDRQHSDHAGGVVAGSRSLQCGRLAQWLTMECRPEKQCPDEHSAGHHRDLTSESALPSGSRQMIPNTLPIASVVKHRQVRLGEIAPPSRRCAASSPKGGAGMAVTSSACQRIICWPCRCSQRKASCKGAARPARSRGENAELRERIAIPVIQG
jgi:hypothetical protein